MNVHPSPKSCYVNAFNKVSYRIALYLAPVITSCLPIYLDQQPCPWRKASPHHDDAITIFQSDITVLELYGGCLFIARWQVLWTSQKDWLWSHQSDEILLPCMSPTWLVTLTPLSRSSTRIYFFWFENTYTKQTFQILVCQFSITAYILILLLYIYSLIVVVLINIW